MNSNIKMSLAENTDKAQSADYAVWLQSISNRYRQSQIKASVAVNTEMLKFYFGLGRDIIVLEKDQPWGSGFLKRLSLDLKTRMPKSECFSPTNLKYMRCFYKLYARYSISHQVGGQLEGKGKIGAVAKPQCFVAVPFLYLYPFRSASFGTFKCFFISLFILASFGTSGSRPSGAVQ